MKNKYIVPLGLAILGIYLIMKSKKSQAKVIPINPLVEPKEPTKSTTTSSGTPSTPSTSSSKFPSDAKSYEVTTQSGNLNLRQFPSTTSKIISSYPKGSIIEARPSSVKSGWHEVLDTSNYFPKVLGYVSSQYLTLKG